MKKFPLFVSIVCFISVGILIGMYIINLNDYWRIGLILITLLFGIGNLLLSGSDNNE